MVKSRDNLVGAFAFLVGVIFAVIMGILQKTVVGYGSNIPYAFLMVLGIIVGFLNTGDRDSITFLIASLALVIVSGFGQSALIYVSNIPILSSLSTILSALLVMFVPATIIVALKTVFSISKV
ncbi:Uncharacterised protein [uncultured archaeon]|nr:Uncharacterised protein [uncultured archaeon]